MAIACFVLFFLDRRNHMEDHAGQNYQHTKNLGAKNWNEDIFKFRLKTLSQIKDVLSIYRRFTNKGRWYNKNDYK